jgi:protease I
MNLKNKKILILVEDLYEDLELDYPKHRLHEEGANVVIAGPKEKHVYKGKHGIPCTAEISFDDVHENEYDALILVGGYAPDKLRRVPKVL